MFGKRKNKRLARAFEKVLNKELKMLGQKTLERSLILVPVNSGTLRDSASIYYKPPRSDRNFKGWTIIYDVPYASDIEEGSSAGPANYTMNIKRHKRRLASGKVTTVTAHTKQYHKHQRPKQIMDDEWRIVTSSSKAGTQFLANAWETVRRGVKDKKIRKMLPEHLSKDPL